MSTFSFIIILATIALGLVGWLFPKYTMQVLSLQTSAGSNMGLSEIRGVNGFVFVALGAAVLYFQTPMAYLMVGVVYAGAAAGRLTSILLENAGTPKVWAFMAVEILFAAVLFLTYFPKVKSGL